jgi:hypothetical protein
MSDLSRGLGRIEDEMDCLWNWERQVSSQLLMFMWMKVWKAFVFHGNSMETDF